MSSALFLQTRVGEFCIAIIAVVLLLVTTLHQAAVAQGNVQYDAQITLSNGRFERGSYAEAFSEAVKAIAIDPSRFEGHYFAGLVLLRQNRPERALSYARDALSRVPALGRTAVDELVVKAERGVRVVKLIEQAQAAEAAGHPFSAASGYTEAFDLDPTQLKAGQSAARTWALLKEPAKVARVLRKVAATDEGTAREDAKKQLAAMANELAKVSRDSIERGWMFLDQATGRQEDRLESAVDAFERASDANPAAGGVDSPYIGLAVVRATQQQKEKFLLAFRNAAQNGVIPDSVGYFDRTGTKCNLGCQRDHSLAPFLCAADVQAALQSIYGPSVLQRARDFCTIRDKRQMDLAEIRTREAEQRQKVEATRKANELAQTSRNETARGWALLDDASGPADGKLEAAAEAFDRAIQAVPTSRGIDSSHMGLTIARAAQRQKDKVLLAFRSAAQNGMTPDSVSFFDRTGARCSLGCRRDEALAPLLCEQDVQAVLEEIYGPSVAGLARQSCGAREKRVKDLAEQRALELENRKRAEADRVEYFNTVSTVLARHQGSCFVAKRDDMTVCLCFGGYDEPTYKLSYRVRIRGISRRTWPEDNSWAAYRHDVQGSLTAAVKFNRSDPKHATLSGTDGSAVTGQIDVRYNFGPGKPLLGTDALKAAIGNSYGGSWSVDLTDGTVRLGRAQSNSLMGTSRVASGCGF